MLAHFLRAAHIRYIILSLDYVQPNTMDIFHQATPRLDTINSLRYKITEIYVHLKFEVLNFDNR